MEIEFNHIAKQYTEGESVLKDFSFKIKPGEFFVMVGPSGSGKSTLLRILAGLLAPSAGQIMFDGRDVTAEAPKNRQLAMVFQNYALLPFMSVADNIRFGLHKLALTKSQVEQRVDEALSLVHLTKLRDRKPKELSGGQQQRVALARAVATKADLVLMDEPLSNLDAKLRAEMRSEIVRLHDTLGMTIVYVTHDQVEAMTMADRILVLSDGQIQQIGTPAALFNHPANRFVADFIGSPSMNFMQVYARDGELTAPEVVDAHIRFNAAGNLADGQYVLGVRPEDFTVVPDLASAVAFPLTVDSCAFLGTSTTISAHNDNLSLVLMVPGQATYAHGATINVELPQADKRHLFDIQTGARIEVGVQ